MQTICIWPSSSLGGHDQTVPASVTFSSWGVTQRSLTRQEPRTNAADQILYWKRQKGRSPLLLLNCSVAECLNQGRSPSLNCSATYIFEVTPPGRRMDSYPHTSSTLQCPDVLQEGKHHKQTTQSTVYRDFHSVSLCRMLRHLLKAMEPTQEARLLQVH